MNITEEALTFDDVLLVPDYSEILPRQASLQTQLTREIKMNIPGNELMIKKETKTFEEGISIGVDSLKRQLKKSKEKLRDSASI